MQVAVTPTLLNALQAVRSDRLNSTPPENSNIGLDSEVNSIDPFLALGVYQNGLESSETKPYQSSDHDYNILMNTRLTPSHIASTQKDYIYPRDRRPQSHRDDSSFQSY